MKQKKEKPTMKDVTIVIGNILNKLDFVEHKAKTVEALFAQYIDFQKNGKKFNSYIEEKLEEINDTSAKDSGKSNEGNRKAKVASIGTKGKTKPRSKGSKRST